MTKKGNKQDIARIALTIAIICFCIGLVTAVPPIQPYTLYGTATLNGKVLTAQDDAVISLKVDGVELVSYTMGDLAGIDHYVLKVPMDSNSSVATAAQEGDSTYIYINGVAINEGVQVIGAPATVVTLDISATSASNPPSTPTLHDLGTTDTDGSYTVSWSAVSSATSYTLEEDTSSSFSSPSVVHSGADTSKDVSGKSDGTYFYRVQACNAEGCSGWSNVEAIVVQISHEAEGWKKTFGGPDNDVAYSVQKTSDGCYILAGYTDSYGAGDSDFWLLKTDSSGKEKWNETFGGTDTDIARSVQQTSDGGFILAGCTKSYGAGSYDAWLVKINSNSDILWYVALGGTGWDEAYSVQETTDGGFIVAGYTDSIYSVPEADWNLTLEGAISDTISKSYFGQALACTMGGHAAEYTDSKGGTWGGLPLWLLCGRVDDANSHSEDSEGAYNDTLAAAGYNITIFASDGYNVAIDSRDTIRNNNYIVASTLNGTHISEDDSSWPLKLVGANVSGSLQVKGVAKIKLDLAPVQPPQIFDNGAGSYDAWLVKIDLNGCIQWEKTFGGTGWDKAKSVRQTSDGGFIIAGLTGPNGVDLADVWLVKTDANGNKQWDKTFGGDSWDSAESVQQTSDGGFILAGYTLSNSAGGSDFWLMKTDSSGNKQWDKTFGGTDDDYAYSVNETTDGGFILAGSTAPLSNNSLMLAGCTDSNGAGGSDAWLVKTYSNGSKQWDKAFGGADDDSASSVLQAADGGYILAGHTKSNGAGGSDAWLVKVTGEGAQSILDTRQSENPYPSIPGTHTGTITPSQDITVQKLYTYPCAGTGGHTESVRISGNGKDESASWNGYTEDRDTITFNSSFTLESGKTYNYVIKTGSYPQIHHTKELQTDYGWLNCTKFTDANGKEYDDWIPAIQLFG